VSDGAPLRGRAAVITGGGRGVGAAVAQKLASAGAAVLVAARTASQVDGVATRLRDGGHTAHATICDVSDESSVEGLAATARDRLGHVDILINSAGIAAAAPIHKTTLDAWTRMLTVNATGAFLCLKVFLPGMVERGWGRVVNVASVAGLSADRYLAAYAASKHAVVGLTRAAAAEVASRGVTVNAVCPGYLHTDMTRETITRIVQTTGRSEDAALEAILQRVPQRRLIEPEEVAEAVAFLCFDTARGITGESLVIDGGDLRR
jgi:NAD(P)-dependent dehydrogenase (short-subunit alcohol dehydrogenase family)